MTIGVRGNLRMRQELAIHNTRYAAGKITLTILTRPDVLSISSPWLPCMAQLSDEELFQSLIGLANLFEFFFGRFGAAVGVGMMLFDQFLIARFQCI